jgi:hypothetical protein
MADAKSANILSSYYAKLYKEKYNVKPIFNRHVARWGFDNVLSDMSVDEIKSLLAYYFETTNTTQNKKHSLDWFLYNYEKLIENQKEQEKDAEERKKIREESEKRAREWRESGKKGIGDN